MTNTTAKTANSTLIFIRGLPGSGKSYLAKKLASRLERDGRVVVLLDPDSVDQSSSEYEAHIKLQIKEGVDPKLHLYRFSRAQAFRAIKGGKIVIWNQPFNDLAVFSKVYQRFTDYANENNINLSIKIIEVNTEPKVAHQRVKLRKAGGGHGPDDAVFQRFVSDYISFDNAGYDIIAVNGEDPIGISVDTIMKSLTGV